MTPPNLDLLVLTFNCAKSMIDAGVFAKHLETAFGSGSEALPDVIVL